MFRRRCVILRDLLKEHKHQHINYCIRGQLKCDGTRAETRFRLSAKWTSPFKSAGASVQSTTGSRVVRISVSNAGYTIFRGSVKGTGYPLHSPVSPSLPLTCVTLSSHFSWSLIVLICWCLCSFEFVTPSEWQFSAETCRIFLRIMYDIYIFTCNS